MIRPNSNPLSRGLYLFLISCHEPASPITRPISRRLNQVAKRNSSLPAYPKR